MATSDATNYQEQIEYHGNTVVEVVRRRNGTVVRRDWLLFDSVEEALEYYSCNSLN